MRLTRHILLLLICLMATPAVASAAANGPDERGFTLQVATFADRTEAIHMADRLDDAWVQEISADGQVLFRVNYKRFSRRNEAVQAQWDLQDLGYKSFIQQLYT